MTEPSQCSDEDETRQLKRTVSQLAEACPIGPKNPQMCPLYPVRKQRPPFRARWIDSLEREDLEFVATYHQVCAKWQSEGRP